MAALTANGSSRFSASERATILALLEEYATALAVYHNTLKKPTTPDNRIPIDCIFSDSEDPEASGLQLSPEDITRLKEAKEEAARVKLYEDSLYVRKLVEDLKEEIREHGTFKVLTKEVEEVTARKKEEEALRARSERLEKLLAQLQETVAEEELMYEEERRRVLKELSEEQSNVEKLKLMADVELKYLITSEKAKCEQKALRCDMETQKLEKVLDDYRIQERNTKRVHEARTKFLIQETERLERQAREWEERYDREKETYEKEIRQLRIEIATRRKELEELKEEYRRNQEFIDTYLAEKEALRREKEAKERAQRSAIRIQAWWRGVMVRRKLGPYRPEEKKKKRSAKPKK
ncbi:uncharacterized protein LOC143178502 [Calliopsis andreniformis]|uniref:uncharacterized protein LOC143178502 n=1 Tax=Calliopsis andreniformis TaxID=337506 RepID=UPI003FCD8199